MGDDPSEEATIFSEMISLLDMRRVFRGVREMIRENENLQQRSLFFDVWGKGYADSVLMHIRRIAKSNSQGVSLMDVLCDLKQNRHMVTRDWYVREFSTGDPSSRREKVEAASTEATFSRHFLTESDSEETSDNPQISEEVLDEDIERLEEIHERCEDYINWRIAHLDTSSPDQIPTFDELYRWIDELRDIFRKYYLLLFGADLEVETVLTHDWRAIFEHPWIQD